MRPFSSPSEAVTPSTPATPATPAAALLAPGPLPPAEPYAPGSGLLSGLFGDAAVDAELTDQALLRALLDVEGALAQAGADAGVLPRAAADAIESACATAVFDPAALGRAADAAGNPVVPLVRQLTATVPPAARPWVHTGATSQDILDTALVLVAVRAGVPLLAHLSAALTAAADLAARHRDTVLVARTLGQQAAPTTFGLKAAGWLAALLDVESRLRDVRGRLPVQFAGAAGTLAGLGPAGAEVADRLADRLGLASSPLPWHTRRQPLLDLAAALGGLLAATGKVALDVGLLAQTEVAEVREGGAGRGGSSALPQKRNPVDSVLIGALARRGPGLVATMFAAAVGEHERAAGGWHAEWEPLLDLLRLAGATAGRTARMLGALEVDPDRMRANLAAGGGVVLAEAVAARLAPALGRTAAHEAVARAAAAGTDFRGALLADPRVTTHLDEADLDAALDPANWLGCAGLFVDRALAACQAATGQIATGQIAGGDVAGGPAHPDGAPA